MGAPADVIEQARAGSTASDYEIWPENEDVLDAFLELQTSWDWVTPGMGSPVRVGIRSTEIESTLRMMGFRGERRIEAFRDLRTMERAAINALSGQR